MSDPIAELQESLESVAERAISADGRSSDNSREIALLKKVDDGQQAQMEKVQEALGRDKAAIEAIELINQGQAKTIASMQDAIDLQQRLIEGLSDRLNGKGLVQVDPYEKVVAMVRQISEVMQGGEGQLSFAQVRNSIQNTQFLGKVMYGAIGLFGIGGVMAAGLALFGVDKVPPEVQALQQKVVDIQGDIGDLKRQFDADIQRRLGEKK